MRRRRHGADRAAAAFAANYRVICTMQISHFSAFRIDAIVKSKLVGIQRVTR
jgi:hypothetical protein